MVVVLEKNVPEKSNKVPLFFYQEQGQCDQTMVSK